MLNYVLNALLTFWLIARAFTQSEQFCSMKVPWMDAIIECLNADGKPMYFHGVTGQTIENIHLRPNVTVWTSEYIYPDQHQKGYCLCSFHYFTNVPTIEEPEELFSYCDDYKFFFCKNESNKVLEVFNNTWEHASRCGSFPRNQLNSIIKPGYYWINKTNECGSTNLAPTKMNEVSHTNANFCGTYSHDVGRHFRRCNTKHRLVCVTCLYTAMAIQPYAGTSLPPDLFDSSCFLGKNTETTEMSTVRTLVSSSYQPQLSKPSENVTTVTSIFETDTTRSLSHTKQPNLQTTDNLTPSGGHITKLSQTSTKRPKNTSEIQILNITLGHARGSSYEHGDQETGTDAGTIAGIVVGVCSLLACAVVLFIFIRKRYRCLFAKNTTSSSMPTTNNGTNNQPKKSKAHTLFNNIGFDTWDGHQKQNHTKKSKRNNTEISNNGMSSINQFRSAEDEEPYYYQTNSTHVTDITDQQTAEASSYSSAVETENNVGMNEMPQDEYDTTISPRKGVYKTENVYNKLEPVNKSSSDVYDSTLLKGKTFETDDVYNQLNCKTKYGKFGTTLSDNEDYDSVSNTLKSHNTQQCTDNVYN